MMLDTCIETGVKKAVHAWPAEAYAICDGDNVVAGVVRAGQNGDHFRLSLTLTPQEMRRFLMVARAALDAAEREEAA